MDAFGWSTQLPAPAAPSDDALLAAFLGANTFEELHCDGAGDGTASSSDVYGALGLPPCQSDLSLLRCQNDGVTLPGRGDASSNVFLNSVGGLLPAIAGAHDGFAFPNVPVEPAQADGSNTGFSGYSTTTGGGGGNISSGESNTYGGGDTEVASPCAMSRPLLPRPRITLPPTKKRLPDKYPAAKVTTVTPTTRTSTTSITFGQSSRGRHGYEPDTEAIAQVKEMIYRAAAMRPVTLGPGEPPNASSTPPEPSSSKPQRRKNVRISSDPQTVAARLRRERVSERLRALQRLVPGGSKMDTASMLDEAASYLRFLKSQVAALETTGGGARGVDDDGRYSSPLQRYVGRNFGLSSRGGGGAGAGGGTVLTFGRDSVTGYAKSNRNMQL